MATAAEEGFEDIVQVIKHINEEENIHVGMLQDVMTTISE
jgi:rubrerythrin